MAQSSLKSKPALNQAAQNSKGYIVTVRGQYYASGETKRMIRTYGPEAFFIPEKQNLKVGYEYKMISVGGSKIKRSVPKMQEVNGLAYALHIIQRYLLPARLALKCKDYIRFRTCTIVDTRRATASDSQSKMLDESKIKEMSLEQLRTLVNLRGLAVPLDSFASIADARQAVQDELDNLKIALEAQDRDESDLEIPGVTSTSEGETSEYDSNEDGSIQTNVVDSKEDDLFA